MIQFRIRYGQFRRELALARHRLAAARALWLALLAPIAALAVRVLGGPVVGRSMTVGAAAVTFAAAWLWPVRRHQSADVRAIDRRFGLDELLVTAVEVDARGPRTPLEAQLLDDAAGRLTTIPAAERREPGRLAVELETAAALGLMLLGGSLLADRWRAAPLPAPLPAIAGQGGASASAAEGGSGAGGGRAPGPAEGGLASALRDQAVARDVVAALDGGDRPAAAEALRSLADHADDLSNVGRGDLADALREASRALAPIDPALARAAEQAGAGLRATPPAAAGAGLDALADALASRADRERAAGTTPSSPGAAAVRIEAAPTVAAFGGGGAGRLPAAPSGGAPTGEGSVAPGGVYGGSGRGGGPSGGGSEAVPPAQREAVRRYFARTDGSDPEAGGP